MKSCLKVELNLCKLKTAAVCRDFVIWNYLGIVLTFISRANYLIMQLDGVDLVRACLAGGAANGGYSLKIGSGFRPSATHDR